jgi:hypothetical protein
VVHLAPGTVRNYLSSAMAKLGASAARSGAPRLGRRLDPAPPIALLREISRLRDVIPAARKSRAT